MNVKFLNLRKHFSYEENFQYNYDAIHLNSLGSAQLGWFLDIKVKELYSENKLRSNIPPSDNKIRPLFLPLENHFSFRQATQS